MDLSLRQMQDPTFWTDKYPLRQTESFQEFHNYLKIKSHVIQSRIPIFEKLFDNYRATLSLRLINYKKFMKI